MLAEPGLRHPARRPVVSRISRINPNISVTIDDTIKKGLGLPKHLLRSAGLDSHDLIFAEKSLNGLSRLRISSASIRDGRALGQEAGQRDAGDTLGRTVGIAI
jgi:hypothetical protein